MKKNCKECPWIVENKHNNMLVDFSKKHNKPHNCHMVINKNNINLWDDNDKFKCAGRKEFETCNKP